MGTQSVDHPNSSPDDANSAILAWHLEAGVSGTQRAQGRLSEAIQMGCGGFHGNRPPSSRAPLLALAQGQPAGPARAEPTLHQTVLPVPGPLLTQFPTSSLLPTTLLLEVLCFPSQEPLKALPAHLPQVQLPPEHPGWLPLLSGRQAVGVCASSPVPQSLGSSSSVKIAASRNERRGGFTLPLPTASQLTVPCCPGSLGASQVLLDLQGVVGEGALRR